MRHAEQCPCPPAPHVTLLGLSATVIVHWTAVHKFHSVNSKVANALFEWSAYVCAAAAPNWPQPLEQAKVVIAGRAQLAAVAARSFWESHRKWLKTWYVKLLGVMALSLGMLTALTNIWGVNWLNEQVVPSATAAVSQQLSREVTRSRPPLPHSGSPCRVNT